MEDILQNAVTKAFRDFHLFTDGTNFRAWMYRYLNMEIYAGNRDYLRSRHESLTVANTIEEVWEFALDTPLVEQLINHSDLVLNHCDEALRGAIKDLRPLERSVLLLKAIGQLKHREISEVLDIPQGTVMSALARGRQRLRFRLANFAKEQGIIDSSPTQVHKEQSP